MTNINYTLYEDEGDAFVTAFVSGQKPYTASTASHPNFAEIVSALKAGDVSALGLFDISTVVEKYFDQLSERVAVKGGHVFFDGDEVDNSLTKQILRFLEAKIDDWQPLVNFMENVASNPNEHSREQLYSWLEARDFTITSDGNLVGYKGVKSDLKSVHSGPGIVNGEAINGHLDNSPGNTVEIARSVVQHDPSNGCASGLHVGTYDYARSWGTIVLKVEVNPRDVVSVPTDCNAAKVRVCRYEVIEVVNTLEQVGEALTSALDGDEDQWDEGYDYDPDDED